MKKQYFKNALKRVSERADLKKFIKTSTSNCGIEYDFVKKDKSKADLDTNYIKVHQGNVTLDISISNPDPKNGIDVYATTIRYNPEDPKNPKIYKNAKSLSDSIKWIEDETGLKINKSNLK